MSENKPIIPPPESGAVRLDEAYVIAKIEQIMAGSAHLRKFLEILEGNAMSGDSVFISIPCSSALAAKTCPYAIIRTNRKNLALQVNTPKRALCETGVTATAKRELARKS